jgi:flagellar hook assembly protein FlgD
VSDRARRTGVIVAMAALFVLALGIFVLPFAFPTPPPIVSRFQATLLFSPDGNGHRDQARVNIRLHEAATLSVEIQRDGVRVKQLIPEAPRSRGFSSTAWNGTGDDGRTLPDGTYAIKLRARSGEKQFNTTRNIVIDTTVPESRSMTVESATLAGAGPGECRVVFTAADPASLVLEALRPDGTKSLRRLGRRPVRAKGVVRWAWDGRAAGGRAVPPGLYVVRASYSDAARNTSVRERTCWVGYLAGRAIPAHPAPRQTVGVALRTTGGDALPPSTPVTLTLRRRTGVPGVTATDPLGPQVGVGARGPLGRVQVRIPAGINPDVLWLVAKAAGRRPGIALIPLESRP